MLYLVGFGLHSYKDITLRGLEAAKSSTRVYLENYTSIHGEPLDEFEELIGKKVFLADREMMEQTDKIVDESLEEDVTLLVVGSPLFATTHTDIIIRAKEKGIRVEVIHNASIINVLGCCGLYSYTFGKVVSIPYFAGKWRPTSFYDNIVKNYQNNLHTLCLLDIKADEHRFMSVNEAIDQILEAATLTGSSLINEDTRIFAICRFGSPTEEVAYERIADLKLRSFGDPLHSLIIPAKLDRVEEELVGSLFE
ncbi:diphthine synthase [Encephalitozoon intestinalis ATCC 50506]|uniref:diphthine methyl ester synthase n=1 Tax=Encephalitozoon intestinalis (strain ATCC 50506) TaxID=876142 RepID=E0SA09_ENCIT|nr:diphthine synthase [Encephalitozoon intestinalis ATCC 50506]ADM12631.1 diphthine synthase [Encephalitozoon intestinalis ATCC 50506]UTX46491.1 diphthine synthase [Encephalitozoon intestinalis]